MAQVRLPFQAGHDVDLVPSPLKSMFLSDEANWLSLIVDLGHAKEMLV